MAIAAQPIDIGIDPHDVPGRAAGERVPALLTSPVGASACFVLAHGAGAGMAHPFLQSVADGLARHGLATLRYQFPFMARGSKRPDVPKVAHATVRAAVAEAGRRWPGIALVAGGKSFGGRMSSQAQAATAMPGVRGIAFLGFPLHPAGKPSIERAAHLDAVEVPMLFLQGTRDALAEPALLQPVVERLGARATLHLVDDADHAFHVPARSGRTDAQVLDRMLDTLAAWTRTLA